MDFGKFAKSAGMADLGWAGGLVAAYSINKLRSPRSPRGSSSSRRRRDPPAEATTPPRSFSAGGRKINFDSAHRPDGAAAGDGIDGAPPKGAVRGVVGADKPAAAAAGGLVSSQAALPDLQEGMLVCLSAPGEDTAPLSVAHNGKCYALVLGDKLPKASSKEGVVRIPAVPVDSLFLVQRRGDRADHFCFRSVIAGMMVQGQPGEGVHRLAGGMGNKESWVLTGGKLHNAAFREKSFDLNIHEVRASPVQTYRDAESSALRDARALRSRAMAAEARAGELDRTIKDSGRKADVEMSKLQRQLRDVMEQAAESQAEAVRGAADLRDFQRVATRLQAELRQLQDENRRLESGAENIKALERTISDMQARHTSDMRSAKERHAEQLRAAKGEAAAAGRAELLEAAGQWQAERARLTSALAAIAAQSSESPAAGDRGRHATPQASWAAVHSHADRVGSHAIAADMFDDVRMEDEAEPARAQAVPARASVRDDLGAGGPVRYGLAPAAAAAPEARRPLDGPVNFGSRSPVEFPGATDPLRRPSPSLAASSPAAAAAAAAAARAGEHVEDAAGPQGPPSARKKLQMGPSPPASPTTSTWPAPDVIAFRTAAGGKRAGLAPPPSAAPPSAAPGKMSPDAEKELRSALDKRRARLAMIEAAEEDLSISQQARKSAAPAGAAGGRGARAGAGGAGRAREGPKEPPRPLNRLCNLEDLFA